MRVVTTYDRLYNEAKIRTNSDLNVIVRGEKYEEKDWLVNNAARNNACIGSLQREWIKYE